MRSATGPTSSRSPARRVRVLFTSYSLRRLLWLVPFGFVVGFIEALGDLLTGHPRRARAAIGSWYSNLLHVRALQPSRRRAQQLRRVHDSELRELQVSSTTRLSAFLAQHLQTDTRLRSIGDASRIAVDSVSDGMRTPAAIAFLGFLVLVAIGSRGIVTGGVPAIGTFGHWPGVGDLFDSFGSAWRYTGLGSASSAPAALALIGAMGTVLLGAVGLAQTLTVVLAIPLGAFGAYRLARRIINLRGPALAAGLAYGINPVARNAIAQGRLGPLVLFALLPFLLLRIVRLGTRDDARKGRVLRLAVLAALLGAWYPAGLGLFVLAAATFVLAVPIAGAGRMALRGFGIAVVAAVGGMVLLFPWPLAYAHTGVDKAAFGFAFRPDLDLSQILRFDTGPAERGLDDVGPGRGRGGAAVRRHRRSPGLDRARAGCWRWSAGRWCGSRHASSPTRRCCAPEAGLTLAALGLALCLGIAVSVFVDGIHTFRFGWRQPAAILGARRDPPARARVHRRCVRRPVGRADERLDEHARVHAVAHQPRASSACCGSATRRCSRSIRSCCATAPGTRSPATAPVTSPSSGVPPSTTPTTSSTAPSSSRPRASPTGSAACSHPWACATSWCRAPRVPEAARRRRSHVAVRTAMAQQLDLAQLRSSAGLVLYREPRRTSRIRASCPAAAVPIDSPRPEPGRARRRPRRRAADHVGARPRRHRAVG